MTALSSTILCWHIDLLHHAAFLMNTGAFSIFCPRKGECCFLTKPCFLHFLSEETKAMEYHIASPSAHKTGTGAENYYQLAFHHFSFIWLFKRILIWCAWHCARLRQTGDSKMETKNLYIFWKISKWCCKEMFGRKIKKRER